MLADLTYRWKNATILIRVIVVLVFFFAIQTLFFLSTHHFVIPVLAKWLGLSNDTSSLLSKPWTIFSYSLFHKNVNHFIGNLVFLYFVGREFLNLFSEKQFLQALFGGILFGAVFFEVLSNLNPAYNGESILLGFSAAILATLITITVYRPKYKLYFTESASVEIWIITLITLLYIILTTNKNTGGNFAHFGAVVFGVVFALYLKGNLVLFKTKTNLKTVHRSVIKSANSKFSAEEQAQIDRILDKMNQSGYDSLSKKEKEYLFKRGE